MKGRAIFKYRVGYKWDGGTYRNLRIEGPGKSKRVQKTEIARNRMSKVSISELQGKWGRIKFSSSACLCLASSLLLGRVFFIQGPDSQFFNAAIL